MPKHPTDLKPESWHRYFAMESNNRAWALSVKERSEQEDQDMLHAAHAAALHWQKVGTELHHMRATMLLAEVHALLGFGASAFRYAQQMRDFFLQKDTPDWELAFTHAIHAHAAQVVGEDEVYKASYHEATKAIEAIVDPKDREIVLNTFEHVPKP